MNPSLRATKTALLIGFACCIASPCMVGAEKVSVTDLPKHALEQSQITITGAPPFHLRAKVMEATNLTMMASEAEIEDTGQRRTNGSERLRLVTFHKR